MYQKFIALGRVGKDVETRRLESGVTVSKFTLATSETYKDKDGQKQEKTEWHNCICFRSLAEIAEKYVKKGALLHVEGKVCYRSYDDKDGQKRYVTEINLDGFKMVGSGGSGEHATTSTNAPQNASNEPNTAVMVDGEPPMDDSLPF